MDKSKNIPEIDFRNRQSKTFEFEILSARELIKNRMEADHDRFRPHRLAFYAILFIVEGEGEHFIDFEKYQFKKGNILFIAKDQVHAFQKETELNAYFLLFTAGFLERSTLPSPLMQQLSLYKYRLYQPVLQLDEAQYNTIYALILRLKEEFDRPYDFATEEILQSRLKILLFLAERVRKTRLVSEKQPYYYEDFLQLQRLLKIHLFETRQVKFYADQMAISTKKINRITSEIVQQPAKTFINDMLMLEIKRFLMNTALSIKEIAYKTGFENPTNFVKFFKHYQGMTPATFRKQY